MKPKASADTKHFDLMPVNASKWLLDKSLKQLGENVIGNLKPVLRTEMNSEHAVIRKRYLTAAISLFIYLNVLLVIRTRN